MIDRHMAAGRRRARRQQLAIWLILFGLLTASFLHVSFAHSGDILAILGIAAGVLLLLQRQADVRYGWLASMD